MTGQEARDDEREALEAIGWSPAAVRRYPEKAFEVMVEFYAQARKNPQPEITDDELRALSDAARPGPWRAYETMQADIFIVEDKQGLLRGPGPVMGPSYDKSTVEYVVALVNRHRASLMPVEEGENRG